MNYLALGRALKQLPGYSCSGPKALAISAENQDEMSVGSEYHVLQQSLAWVSRVDLRADVGLQVQDFIAYLRSTTQHNRRSKRSAGVRAAIIMQRQMANKLLDFDPGFLANDAKEVKEHNAQLPRSLVLLAHQTMMVGYPEFLTPSVTNPE